MGEEWGGEGRGGEEEMYRREIRARKGKISSLCCLIVQMINGVSITVICEAQ